MVQKCRNHEWMQTWKSDVKPFDNKAFKLSEFTGKLTLKQNHFLI